MLELQNYKVIPLGCLLIMKLYKLLNRKLTKHPSLKVTKFKFSKNQIMNSKEKFNYTINLLLILPKEPFILYSEMLKIPNVNRPVKFTIALILKTFLVRYVQMVNYNWEILVLMFVEKVTKTLMVLTVLNAKKMIVRILFKSILKLKLFHQHPLK